jgi:hypothetical protein
MITRQELQDLRKRAWALIEVTPEDGWLYAYRELVRACNALDALMARNIAGAGSPDYEGTIPGKGTVHRCLGEFIRKETDYGDDWEQVQAYITKLEDALDQVKQTVSFERTTDLMAD